MKFLERLSVWLVPEPERGDYFAKYLAAEREIDRLRSVLMSEYHTNKAVRHAQHVADLEESNKNLRSQVREMQLCAERHNAEAYATGLIVKCTGCNAGGPFGGDELTEERVVQVEVIAKRLRSWFNNRESRKRRRQSKGEDTMQRDIAAMEALAISEGVDLDSLATDAAMAFDPDGESVHMGREQAERIAAWEVAEHDDFVSIKPSATRKLKANDH